MTLIAITAAFFLGGCARCDCDKDRDKDDRHGRNEQTGGGAYDGDYGNGTGSGERTGGTSGRDGSGYMDKNASGSERTTVRGGDGVGNANTERGVNTFDNDGAPANTTTQPARKPGTTGSYRTRASGTGTQSGRQVN